MTWLIFVPFVLALLVVLALPLLHGDDETDRRLDSVDRELDERMRRQYGGWRW